VANDKKLINKQFHLKRPAELILNTSGKTLGLKFQAHLNKSLLRRMLWERADCPSVSHSAATSSPGANIPVWKVLSLLPPSAVTWTETPPKGISQQLDYSLIHKGH